MARIRPYNFTLMPEHKIFVPFLHHEKEVIVKINCKEKISRSIPLVFLLAFAVLGTGCATSRSEVKLAGPSESAGTYQVTKQTVVLVRSVKDERVFEETPSSPSIPSIGHEGTNNASADTKARAFARKRNGFGKALGEVLLEKGQTVSDVVRDNVVAAFRQAGFRTTTDPKDAGRSPMVVDVHVKQLWAWMNPGFWSISMNASITTNLDTNKSRSPVVVDAHAEKGAMAATDGTWVEILDMALKDYRDKVAKEYANLP